jgi:hypothetical protein
LELLFNLPGQNSLHQFGHHILSCWLRLLKYTCCCLWKKYFTAQFINVSLITVTLFNIGRCCSIKFDLQYSEIVTPKVLKMACLLSWLLRILISYLMFFYPSHNLGIFCGWMFKASFNAVSYSTNVMQVLTISSNLFVCVVVYTFSIRIGSSSH